MARDKENDYRGQKKAHDRESIQEIDMMTE